MTQHLLLLGLYTYSARHLLLAQHELSKILKSLSVLTLNTQNYTNNGNTAKSPFEVVYGLHTRGVCELRDLKDLKGVSGHADDFAQSVKGIHE